MFFSIGNIVGNVLPHNISKNLLAVISLPEELTLFVSRLVFVDAHHLGQVVQLEVDWATHDKVHQVVVHKWHTGFQAVCHAELVFNHKQTMQKGLGFEVERVVDVVLGPLQLIVMREKDVAEDIPGPDVFHIVPDRRKELLDRAVIDQPLPV